MTADTEKTLLYVGLGALAVMVVAPEFFGQLVGRTAVGAGKVVVKTAEGLVVGVGEAVGIPPTDATLCEQAIADGRWWDASFYCPAGTFLKSAAGAVMDQAGNVIGYTPATGQAELINVTPAAQETTGAYDIWDIPQPEMYPGPGGVDMPWDFAA